MLNVLRKHELVLKYITVGVSASVTDLFLLATFTEYFHWWYLTSAVLALVMSFSLAFVVQKYWTFGDFSEHNIHGQFFWYLLTVIFSIVLNLIILSLLVEFTYLHYLPAQAISLCIVGIIGFVLNVRNVFSHVHSDSGVAVASGIYPPEIGGPARHMERLAKELAAKGISVTVVTYTPTLRVGQGDGSGAGVDVIRIPRDMPVFLRGLAYFVFLFLSSVRHSNIFAQDVTSTGLPALLVKKILPHKKFIIRIGGDRLWESRVESDATTLTLPDYYASGDYKKDFLFKVGRFVMLRADKIIVPATFLKEIYVKYYGIPQSKFLIIKNPVPVGESSWGATTADEEQPIASSEKIILYAGRFLKLKNLNRLIGAFSEIYPEIEPARLILAGDGPERGRYLEMIGHLPYGDRITVLENLPRGELMARIGGTNLCVCPSLSEVNSNFSLECLALGKPVLLTKYNGLSVKLPEKLLFSPENEKELGKKIKELLLEGYDTAKLTQLVATESIKSSWEGALELYFKVFDL